MQTSLFSRLADSLPECLTLTYEKTWSGGTWARIAHWDRVQGIAPLIPECHVVCQSDRTRTGSHVCRHDCHSHTRTQTDRHQDDGNRREKQTCLSQDDEVSPAASGIIPVACGGVEGLMRQDERRRGGEQLVEQISCESGWQFSAIASSGENPGFGEESEPVHRRRHGTGVRAQVGGARAPRLLPPDDGVSVVHRVSE